MAASQTLWVATNGNDLAPGTDVAPLASIPFAVQRARRLHRDHPQEPVRILVHGGNYLLSQPLVLTPEDDELVIAACRHEKPVITSGFPIKGWRYSSANPNVWQANVSSVAAGPWHFYELFVNGERKARTRLPAEGFFHSVGIGVKGQPHQLQFHPGDILPQWAQTGDVELITLNAWAQARNQIRSVNSSSSVVTLAGDALAANFEPNGRIYLENVRRALQPGEWYLNSRTGWLSYWPEAGEDVPHARITLPALNELVRLKGQPGHPVRGVVLRGLTFAETDWTLHEGSDFDLQADVETHGALRAEWANDCAVEKCTFTRLGGYAVDFGRGCQRDRIIDNEMFDLGGGGIRIGEGVMADALSAPCGHHLIENNHIHHIGLVNAPAVGIFVLLSGQNRIAHNEIDHTFYTTISVGWTWGYGPTPCRENRIEFNRLHDIGQGMLSDMGGVYTLGLQPGTVVRNNIIHDVHVNIYGGWGLYTDEGSSGIVLESNVVYRCQSAGFHQHYGRDNIIRNNIFAFNQDFQLMRTRTQPNLSFIFTNNIVYFDSGRLFGGNWSGNDLQMDHNIYFDTRPAAENPTRNDLRAWQALGFDRHSLFIDPLFVAALQDNFRLRRDSPALRFGFGQIKTGGVGIR
jgi:parallel beta-helix repeat protein